MSTKILVVEDEQSFQKIIKQYFKRQIKSKKYQFTFAENGKEALQIIVESGDIDLLITDLKMPQIDGIELLTILNYLNIEIDTIIISAYGEMENIRKAMNEGVFDFLVKPFELSALEKAIENIIKKRSANKNGYIEKRYVYKKQQTGKEKEYGPYIYFRKRDEERKLSSIYLGKDDPWLQKLLETAESSSETLEN